ncbi:MAG: PhzF family phenazine biosynthesis isomerase [Candidatus Thiodiazotropha sp.]
MSELFQVDAFTETPFRGNPAAVCLLDEERDTQWMQALAMEMNLSETAFLRPRDGGYDLRWFTPKTEVNLCGHATLASAHVLRTHARVTEDEIRFFTRSGTLLARFNEMGIELDFPSDPVKELVPEFDLAGILGQPIIATRQGREKWLVELASEDAVAQCHPDMARLAALPALGLIITARGSTETDFVSRFFAPAAGVDEDPVTGSAHCTLADYWSERLGKRVMQARQLSARGGRLQVRQDGERVYLTGKAVTILKGKLNV